MIKYATVANKGRGFITHADQETSGLKFQVEGDIVTLEGSEKSITEWMTRNSAVEKTESASLAIKKTQNTAGLRELIKDLNSRLVEAEKELATLTR